MKNIISVIAVSVLLAFSFSSCQKAYTCVCQGGFAGGIHETQISAANHKAAERKCTKTNPKQGESYPDAMYCKLK